MHAHQLRALKPGEPPQILDKRLACIQGRQLPTAGQTIARLCVRRKRLQICRRQGREMCLNRFSLFTEDIAA